MAKRYTYIPNRVIDQNGVSSGATISVFQTGTTTPVTIYSDEALTTPLENPLTVSAGAIVPVIYHNESGDVRVVVAQSDGTTISDDDPYTQGVIDAAQLAGPSGGDLVGGVPVEVATRTALKALSTTNYSAATLTESGREGLFFRRSGSPPSTDTQEGVYVVSDTSGFYWERDWDGMTGHPEWFGVTLNSSGAATANLAAINACIELCPVTQFGNADYWIDGRMNVQTPYRTVQGHRGDGYNTATGTRVISTDGTNPVVRFGPDTQPSDTTLHMRGIAAFDITFQHNGTRSAPASGSESQAIPCVDRRWLIKAVFQRLNAWEPLIGFYARGLIQCYTSECKVLRTAALTLSSGDDFCWANFIDGAAVASGLPGNPSYYEENFAAEFSPSLSIEKVGLYMSADFSDVFLNGFETSNADNGARLEGSGSKAQINTHLRGFVFDQCAATALDIQGLVAGAAVNVIGGYYQAKSTATAAVHVRGGNGTVNFGDGCQIVCGEAGSTIGLYVQGQQAVNVDNTVNVLECPRPVLLTGVSGAHVLCSIQNDTIGDATQAVLETDASDGVIAQIQARGKDDAFARGYSLVGTSNDRVSLDPTLIDRNMLDDGASDLVVVDPFGTPATITAPGYYTSAGASGTSGAGIYVTGITA